MIENKENKVIIAVIIIGVIIIAVCTGLIIMNVINDSHSNNNDGNNVSNNEVNNEVNNEENTSVTDHPLHSEYPNAQLDDLNIIDKIKKNYNVDSDMEVVKILLERDSYVAACVFIENSQAVNIEDLVESHLENLINAYCLSDEKKEMVDNALKDYPELANKDQEEFIIEIAQQHCYDELYLGNVEEDELKWNLSQIDLSEIGSPIKDHITNREYNLTKSTIEFTDYCENPTLNLVKK